MSVNEGKDFRPEKTGGFPGLSPGNRKRFLGRGNRLSMSDAPDPFPDLSRGMSEMGVPVATNRSDCQARPGEQSENGLGPGAS